MDSTDNGDDFDSFFNTKKTKPQQKSSKTVDPMEDLFGLEDKTQNSRKLQTKSSTSARINKEPEDDDDDLGFDPKKPKALGKGQNLFDDLLGPLETKRPQTAGVSQAKPPISRQSTETTTDTSNIFQTQAARPKTSQGRRTSNMSSAQNPDPLGLFAKDTSKPSSTINTPRAQKRGTTADWLGLAKEPEPEPIARVDTQNITKTKTNETVEILKLSDNNENREEREQEDPEQEEQVEVQTINPPASDNNFTMDTTSHNIMLINSLNQEAHQSFSALKYQEQQLIMATQMKQQERMLLEMQHKQDTLLKKQERQFQNLVQQQMERHQQLEQVIKQQQQRINSHIQLMMTQTPMTEIFHDFEMEGKVERQSKSRKHDQIEEEQLKLPLRDLEKEKQLTLDLIQFESDNRRLELENLRLEEVVANTKSNYEKEIELMERSYKWVT